MQDTTIAVTTFTVRDFMKTREETIATYKKLKEMGFGALQTGVGRLSCTQELKDVLDEIGLDIVSHGASVQKMIDDPKSVADDCKILGVDTVGIGTIPWPYRDTEAGYRYYIKLFNEAARRVGEYDLKLAYHNHAQEFRKFTPGGITGMDLLFNEMDPRNIGFLLDTHWVQSGGADVVKWIYKCRGRMDLIHFKDYEVDTVEGDDRIESYSKYFAEIGEGSLEWPAIIKACADIGVKYHIIEQDICKRNPFDSLAISLKNMKAFGMK